MNAIIGLSQHNVIGSHSSFRSVSTRTGSFMASVRFSTENMQYLMSKFRELTASTSGHRPFKVQRKPSVVTSLTTRIKIKINRSGTNIVHTFSTQQQIGPGIEAAYCCQKPAARTSTTIFSYCNAAVDQHLASVVVNGSWSAAHPRSELN